MKFFRISLCLVAIGLYLLARPALKHPEAKRPLGTEAPASLPGTPPAEAQK